MKREAGVARRYAKALGMLAAEESRLEPVAKELQAFERVLADEAVLRDALLMPWVKAAAKRAIVASVAERLQLSLLTRNFLALVAQRRRLALLPAILEAYRALVDEAGGRVRAHVRSAAPLSEAQRAAIRERLGRRLGKTVLLETEVDPTILGGFVAEVGTRLLDASVAGQLRALGEQLTRDSGGRA
ncbi:MAG TPA: ATP synthase F1 subunit delta [Methylomirabilota bacterium]|jgi:F-type H+-transporting ATPase subunit delta|nr:ATP synthase F1 subunit delta [Methylomirabilota bacterium]